MGNDNNNICLIKFNDVTGRKIYSTYKVQKGSYFKLPKYYNKNTLYYLEKNSNLKYEQETIIKPDKNMNFNPITSDNNFTLNIPQVKILLIAGATRSGKSTLARNLLQALNIPKDYLVHLDLFFDPYKILENLFKDLISCIKTEDFQNFYRTNASEKDKEEINDFLSLKPQDFNMKKPEILGKYIAEKRPELMYDNWEQDESINWEDFNDTILETIIKAQNNKIKYIIIEGFRLLQERDPFQNTLIQPYKSFFLLINKATAQERRQRTKRMRPGEFENVCWPEYIKAHKYLYNYIMDNKDLTRFGELILIDGSIEEMLNTLLSNIESNINNRENNIKLLNKYNNLNI